MEENEEPLTGGNSNPDVVRIGDTVRRAAGPWTPTVHRLLRHLAEVGYPAPRPLGLDTEGREILTFLPGRTVEPDQLHLVADRAGLRRVGRLISDYHRAQRGFAHHRDAHWQDLGRDPTGSAEVIAHNDLAPWNLVAGSAGWAFIDWDLAAPGRRFWDLAWALHSFVGLWPDRPVVGDTIGRIAAFCDGADVAPGERGRLLSVVVERTADHAALLRRLAAADEEPFATLVADGHADVWEAGSAHVELNRDRWTALLAP